jgi:hypothetical protein
MGFYVPSSRQRTIHAFALFPYDRALVLPRPSSRLESVEDLFLELKKDFLLGFFSLDWFVFLDDIVHSLGQILQ